MDWQTYSSEIGAVALEELDEEQLHRRRSMLECDPPRHTAAPPGHVEAVLRPRASAGTRTSSATWRAACWTGRSNKDEFDFVGEISRELPIRFLCSIFTVPAGRRPSADRVGRQDDREPGPGPVGRRRGPGRHRGVPASPVPLPRRPRGVVLRRPPARAARGRARRRRDPGADGRAVGGHAQPRRLPQLLLAADDRRQRDHAAHDLGRHARADGAPRPAAAAAGRPVAHHAGHRGDPAMGDAGPALPADGDAGRTSSAGSGSRPATRSSRGTSARTATRRSSPTPTGST